MANVRIDNRGLAPPEPMVRILSGLAELGDGDELVAVMDREPHMLFAELERRGFIWEFAVEGDGGVLTVRRLAGG
jgi:tRNA 2-thiouridine synthesizing protein A